MQIYNEVFLYPKRRRKKSIAIPYHNNVIQFKKVGKKSDYRAQSEFFVRYIFKSTKHLFSKGKPSEEPAFNNGNNLCRIWYSSNCKTVKRVMT